MKRRSNAKGKGSSVPSLGRKWVEGQNVKIGHQASNDSTVEAKAGRTMWNAFLSSIIYSMPVVAAVLVFWPAMFGFGYCWDDLRAIEQNKDVHGITPWKDLWANDFWGTPMTSIDSHKSYRPLAVFSFRWQAMLLGTVSAESLHQGNIALHALCTSLVAIIGNSLPGFSDLGTQKKTALWVAAMLFAVHSVHTEAVAGLVGRADLMCAIFFQLGVLCYSRDNTILALLAGLAAMLSKESGITVFGVYCALEALRTKGLRWSRLILQIVTVLSALYARISLHGDTPLYKWSLTENHISLESSLWVRACSYAHTHALYAMYLIWPSPLSYSHSYAAVPVLTSPSLLTVIAYGLLLLVIAHCWIRSDRGVFICVALALLPFVPASNVLFPVGTVLAERLLYLPSIGFCLLVGLGAGRILQLNTRWSRLMVLLPVLVVVSVLSLHTWQSCKAWEDNSTLFLAGALNEPESATTLNNYGHDQMHKGNLDVAEKYLEKAIEVHPEYPVALHNLGLVYKRKGRINKAIKAFREAFSLQDSCILAALLGSTLQDKFETHGPDTLSAEESVLLNNTLEIATNETCNVPFALASLVRKISPSDKALELIDRIPIVNLKSIPNNRVLTSEIVMLKGNVFADRGELIQAVGLYEDALNYPDARLNVYSTTVTGWFRVYEKYGNDAKWTAKDGSRSLQPLERVRELIQSMQAKDPSDLAVFAQTSYYFELLGDYSKALEQLQSLKKLIPEHPRIAQSMKRIEGKMQAE